MSLRNREVTPLTRAVGWEERSDFIADPSPVPAELPGRSSGEFVLFRRGAGHGYILRCPWLKPGHAETVPMSLRKREVTLC